jgi:hypothetical protein
MLLLIFHYVFTLRYFNLHMLEYLRCNGRTLTAVLAKQESFWGATQAIWFFFREMNSRWPPRSSHCWTLAYQHWGLSSIPGDFVGDSWWTNRHWSKLFSDSFRFPILTPISSIHTYHRPLVSAKSGTRQQVIKSLVFILGAWSQSHDISSSSWNEALYLKWIGFWGATAFNAVKLYVCLEGTRPPMWSSGQSSWLERFRGLWFDSQSYQIFWEVVVLERGPLSLVRITEELLEWKK